MVDLVQTPANVAAQAGSGQQKKTAGGNVVAGQPVYISSNSLVLPAECDVDAASAESIGIALADAANGQPVIVQVSGPINVGATLVVGETYVVSANAGGIAPIADLVVGNFPTILGVAISTSVMRLGILPSGVARA